MLARPKISAAIEYLAIEIGLSIGGGQGCANYESDFLLLLGIPANQCREYPHTAPSLRAATLPIATRYVFARSLFGPAIVASHRVIGNSVSTDNPKDT